ncbi:MAG: DUF2147 domain-containing protein [Elusimicrobium sp.]|jgi:uncharacterized protein (DUF2147 family)|nr:DUF2147 domain-containing protein [Elusimicrobium sp.]
MKKLLTFIFMLAAVCLKAQDVPGFWQTFDDKTKEPKSVVAVYKYDDKIYGRVILTYEPGTGGKTVRDTAGNPSHDAAKNVVRIKDGKEVIAKICGLDFIREMKPSAGKDWLYEDGFILDPKSGDEYKAKMKFDKDGNLVVKGHLKISSLLGRSQTWKKFDPAAFPANFKAPDYKNFVPDPPKVK